MSLFGEKLIPKLGRLSINIGCIIMAIGLCLAAYLLHHYTYSIHSWQLIPALMSIGIGMGFVFGSLFAAVLNGVDASHAGSASGVLNAVQQVGGAVGIAIIGVIFFGQLGHSAVNSFNKVTPQLTAQLTAAHVPASEQASIISGTERCFVDRSKEKDATIIPASCISSSGQSKSESSQLSSIISKSAAHANSNNFDNAFHWATFYEACVLAFVFCLSFFLPRKFKTDAFSEI
jgi:MFS family permease